MMTITLLLAGAALAAAMGLYDAWSNKRSLLGWIVSILASVVGGVFVGGLLPQVLILTLGNNLSKDAALYVGLGAVLAGVLIGSSVALRIVNRFQ